jgi:heme A synthase
MVTHRRRFRISLRTLLIGVVLLSCVCAAGGYVAHEAAMVRERRAMRYRILVQDKGNLSQ